MPQQINLHHPALSSPRRHLPAAALLRALLVWAVVLLALAAWTVWRTQSLGQELAGTQAQHAREREQLLQAQQGRQPASGPTAALQQELTTVETRLAERQRVLAALGTEGAADTPTPWLQQLTQDLPETVWLSEIAWSPQGRELAGYALTTEALQGWLQRSGEPQALRVEHQRGQATPLWAFRVRQGQPPGTPAEQQAASGSAAGTATGAATGTAVGASHLPPLLNKVPLLARAQGAVNAANAANAAAVANVAAMAKTIDSAQGKR